MGTALPLREGRSARRTATSFAAVALCLLSSGCSVSPEPTPLPSDRVSQNLTGSTERQLVFERTIGTYGTGPGQMAFPRGVAVDPVGRLFVADTGNHRILQFDPAGVFLAEFGGLGFEVGRFHGPRDLVVGETLDLLVLDGENRRVVRYDLDGNLIGVALDLGPEGPNLGLGWFEVSGMGAASWGTVFLSDAEGSRLLAYEPLNGAFRVLGGYGDAPGFFHGPTGLALNDQGSLLVADGGNGRVQALDSRGAFVRAWPLADGETPGHIAVAWLRDGLVAVAEAAHSRLSVLSPGGRTLAVLARAGEKEGELRSPSALAVDRHQRIYVADTDNHRISVFRLDGNAGE